MKLLLKHKGYEAFSTPIAGQLCAIIQRPSHKVGIPEIPAVSMAAGEKALGPMAKAAIGRDLQTRR